MDILDNLNPQQTQAVTATNGPVLVLAGPGSGKTRVLTHHIAYLVGALGVRPYHIMAVTFTNKAAREMEHRVAQLLPDISSGLTLGTFHAICARILRREAERLPVNNHFVIYDADDQLSLVKQVVKELNLDDKQFRPASFHSAISKAKNELTLPEDIKSDDYRTKTLVEVYTRYQKLLYASNALDFDDLLLWTARLLEEHPDIRQRYARRFEHVLVDEFQDTNTAQYILLKHLASYHQNIFVVGDIDQAIYRWRGADYRNIRRFEMDFPQTRVILLEQNYRSTQKILDVAMAVIDQNPNRHKKRLFTHRGAGRKAILMETHNDYQEADFVVETIASLVARREQEPGDFAVMYRTNAQSRLLEQAFISAGLPYRLVGAQRFYGRREIKDLVGYLRLIINPADEASLSRVINTPTRGIGAKTLETLRKHAVESGISSGHLLLDLAKEEKSQHAAAFTGRSSAPLAAFGMQLTRWRSWMNDATPLFLLDRIIADIEYEGYLKDGTEEGIGRWENIGELRRLASEYEERGLTALLEDVALVSDQDTINQGGNVPTLLTLHAAKGLEFPVVFIVGLEEKTLPHSRSLDDPEEMEEERRLFYVGVTRAQDRLYLLYARARGGYGGLEYTDPSRFLQSIPVELLEVPGGSSKPTERLFAQPSDTRWESKPARPAQVRKAKYSPGTRVQHPVWGEGMVLKTEIDGDDEIIDVFFMNAGMKRVAASIARLEIKGG